MWKIETTMILLRLLSFVTLRTSVRCIDKKFECTLPLAAPLENKWYILKFLNPSLAVCTIYYRIIF